MIDVIMLTKNSNKPYFRRVLRAVKEKIPVHHFIVVDGYSTDGTVETVKKFFGSKVRVIRTAGTLGYARLLGLLASDTEWVAFVDSDVEILDGYDTAKPLMRSARVWGIQGVFADSTTKTHILNRELNRDIKVVYDISQANAKTLFRYGFYKFFGASTSYVYLRRRIVEIIDPYILSQLDSGEDLYMAWEIARRGFLYIRYKKLRAHHYGGSTSFLNWRKLVRRAFNPHGLAYKLDLGTLLVYLFARLASALRRRDLNAALIVAAILLCLPVAKMKLNASLKYTIKTPNI